MKLKFADIVWIVSLVACVAALLYFCAGIPGQAARTSACDQRCLPYRYSIIKNECFCLTVEGDWKKQTSAESEGGTPLSP